MNIFFKKIKNKIIIKRGLNLQKYTNKIKIFPNLIFLKYKVIIEFKQI